MPDRGYIDEAPKITTQAEADAVRKVLTVMELAITALPLASPVRDNLVADATRLRTRLTEYEGA
jgi:hypothetical protein